MIADLTKDYLAGVAGGVAVVLIGHPFDTVKTRLQTSPLGIYHGTVDCVQKTFQQEGAKGFYSGIGVFTYCSLPILELTMVLCCSGASAPNVIAFTSSNQQKFLRQNRVSTAWTDVLQGVKFRNLLLRTKSDHKQFSQANT